MPILCFASLHTEQKTYGNIFNSGYGWHFDGRKAVVFLAVQQGLPLIGTVNRSKIMSVLVIHVFNQLGLKYMVS